MKSHWSQISLNRPFMLWFITAMAIAVLACQSGNPKSGIQTESGYYGPYQNLYNSYFEKLPPIAPEAVRRVGMAISYPCPVAEVWRAALEILGQYDGIGRIARESWLVVFTNGRALAFNQSDASQQMRYYDAVFALALQSRGERATAVSLAWLRPGDLKPVSIPTRFEALDDKKLMKANEKTRREWVTGGLATELYAHLSTQLLYKDRWRGKFGF